MANNPASLKTASKRIRHLGSAKSGVGAARAMHVTSVALIPLTVAFAWVLVRLAHKDLAGARAEIAQPWAAIATMLFVGVSIYHMKLGMQVIVDDYVHDHHMKDWALIANLFFCTLVGLASVYAILKVSLG